MASRDQCFANCRATKILSREQNERRTKTNGSWSGPKKSACPRTSEMDSKCVSRHPNCPLNRAACTHWLCSDRTLTCPSFAVPPILIWLTYSLSKELFEGSHQLLIVGSNEIWNIVLTNSHHRHQTKRTKWRPPLVQRPGWRSRTHCCIPLHRYDAAGWNPALFVSRADKIVISALFACSFVWNNISFWSRGSWAAAIGPH